MPISSRRLLSRCPNFTEAPRCLRLSCSRCLLRRATAASQFNSKNVCDSNRTVRYASTSDPTFNAPSFKEETPDFRKVQEGGSTTELTLTKTWKGTNKRSGGDNIWTQAECMPCYSVIISLQYLVGITSGKSKIYLNLLNVYLSCLLLINQGLIIYGYTWQISSCTSCCSSLCGSCTGSFLETWVCHILRSAPSLPQGTLALLIWRYGFFLFRVGPHLTLLLEKSTPYLSCLSSLG